MQITVETTVAAPIAEVWRAYTTPADILRWNAASDDWHTTDARFAEGPGGVRVRVTFDPETEYPVEQQRAGWQSILDNFRKHVEGSGR